MHRRTWAWRQRVASDDAAAGSKRLVDAAPRCEESTILGVAALDHPALPITTAFRQMTVAIRTLLPCSLILLLATAGAAADRPNVLWLTSEDNSCYLGCYGDPQAHTPHLDALAAAGVCYRNAFANAPVCSTARSTLITGMHASSLGLQHHRSRVAIPEGMKLYPQLLRQAGYYCTNNVKTDYNVAGVTPDQIWDASSRQAHYRGRAPGQPFFAVFNSTTSHEGKVAAPEGKTDFRLAPQQFQLPPFHPDTMTIRRDWANYYDQMTAMDAEMGELLDELQRLGLAEDTIVFYYSDHGGALPGGKRSIQDAGTRVPLIIHFPEKYQHLAPRQPGGWDDRPVSFVDLPATLLSLCGVPIPDHYEGVPFLGDQQRDRAAAVYLLRGRMDERYDTARSIRDRRWRYVKNYSPHRPQGQHYSYAFRVQPSMRSWHQELTAGRTDEVQSRYWLPKPAEEFYDVDIDPLELENLIDVDAHADKIAALRKQLQQWMIRTRDTGLIPEGMFEGLAGQGTIYQYAQSDAYQIERLIQIADMATSRDEELLEALVEAAADDHPLVRYWAATGLLVLGAQDESVAETLQRLVEDDWNDVRTVAAEAIGHAGQTELALATLHEVCSNGNRYEVLAAQNAAEYLWRGEQITLEQALTCVDTGESLSEPTNRIPELLQQIQQRQTSD